MGCFVAEKGRGMGEMHAAKDGGRAEAANCHVSGDRRRPNTEDRAEPLDWSPAG